LLLFGVFRGCLPTRDPGGPTCSLHSYRPRPRSPGWLLRADRNLTQASFAEAVGITTKHLQKIELGELNMTSRTLSRLADHLEVGIGTLFDAPESRTMRRGRPPRRTPSSSAGG